MTVWALAPRELAGRPVPPPDRPLAVVLLAHADDPAWGAAAPAPLPEDLRDAAGARAADGGAGRLWRRRLARLLVGRVLARAPAAVVLDRDPDGRPRIVEPEGLHLSASGRGGWSAVALAERPVGIDLELWPARAADRGRIRDFACREAFAKALALPLDAALRASNAEVAARIVSVREAAEYVAAVALGASA